MLLALLMNSCHKDSEFSELEIISNFSPEVVQEVSGYLAGYVYDDEGRPVADAVVQIYSGMTTTNEHGVFSFRNARLDKQGTFVRVMKSGFMTGSDMVYPTGGQNMSYIQLFKLRKEKSFKSEVGGEIAITGGGKLVFPADAIIKKDGSEHKGNVYVTAHFLSPVDPDLGDKMPGALIARRTNGNTAVLGTAGMFAADLKDDSGNQLNIKPGKKVSFEIPALSESKPSVIELWHFDDTKGVWVEEGVATLNAGSYVGQVSHFSFWNCDVPFSLINVCGKVLDQNGNPLAYAKVKVSADGLNTAFGLTDEKGEFCGKMPKSKLLTFKVLQKDCPEPIYTIQQGPFENNVVLDPFIVTINEDIVIKGTVSCSGALLEEAFAILDIKDDRVVIPVKESGQFHYHLPACLNVSLVKLFAFDNLTGKASGLYEIVPANVPVINLDVCKPACDFEGELAFDCVERVLSVSVTGGSGNFSYKWSNGWENDSLKISPNMHNTVLCVTVRDKDAECEKQFCQFIDRVMEVRLVYFCGAENVKTNVLGGVPPYTYLWSNGFEGSELAISSAGNYSLTVTDALGCKAERDIEVSDRLSVDPTAISCNGHIFEVPSTPFGGGTLNSNGITNPISLIYPIRFSVFETGFSIWLVIYNDQCEVGAEIELPRFKGLKNVVKTIPSCDTCEDGKIQYEIDTNADCTNCNFGGVRILMDDNDYTNVTALNDAGNLKKGNYIVAVYDSITNCYIAFEKVKL